MVIVIARLSHRDGATEDEIGKRLLRATAERLSAFGRVDAGQPYTHGNMPDADIDGIAVDDAGHAPGFALRRRSGEREGQQRGANRVHAHIARPALPAAVVLQFTQRDAEMQPILEQFEQRHHRGDDVGQAIHDFLTRPDAQL